METKKCIRCGADIYTFASRCPHCNCGPLKPGVGHPSSINLDFFGLSLYKPLIDRITSEYVSKYGNPEKILDTTYYAVEDDHFYHRFLFFNDAKKIVFISPDKQITIPYSQIIDYSINDYSFVTGSPSTATTTTDTGSIIGRAAVGAFLAGSTGAIIGGTTASKTTSFEDPNENVEPRFSILINTNTISKPIIEIDFEEHKDTLQQLVAILEIILRNKQNDAEPSNENIEEPTEEKKPKQKKMMTCFMGQFMEKRSLMK